MRALVEVGDNYLKLGDLRGARDNYDRALGICRALVDLSCEATVRKRLDHAQWSFGLTQRSAHEPRIASGSCSRLWLRRNAARAVAAGRRCDGPGVRPTDRTFGTTARVVRTSTISTGKAASVCARAGGTSASGGGVLDSGRAGSAAGEGVRRAATAAQRAGASAFIYLSSSAVYGRSELPFTAEWVDEDSAIADGDADAMVRLADETALNRCAVGSADGDLAAGCDLRPNRR